MTYAQLEEMMFKAGCNNADIALGSMMDQVEIETGEWPDWDDEAPDWVIEQCLGKRRD